MYWLIFGLFVLFCYFGLGPLWRRPQLSLLFSILNPYFLFVCFCHIGDYQISLGAEEDGPYTRLLCLVCYVTMTLNVLFTSYLPPSVHLKPHCRFFCAPQVSHCVHFHLIIERFLSLRHYASFFSTSPGSSDNPRDVCQTSNWFTQTRTHKHTTRNLRFASGRIQTSSTHLDSNASKLWADFLGTAATAACPIQHGAEPRSRILTDCDI